jgi:hypothetical protein
MPSPFPGMDPFIELEEWSDFHALFNVELREWLTEQLGPRYLVRAEKRVYVDQSESSKLLYRKPDVVIAEGDPSRFMTGGEGGNLATEPVECLVEIPEQQEEVYLVIKERETMQVVTVIETLSPANKRPGGNGRREYLDKRSLLFRSASHTVELDLLRGGERLPMISPYPPGDYFAIVRRAPLSWRVLVYHWSLRQPMPDIQVPLSGQEEVTLPLQEIFNTVYGRARYDWSIDYSAPPDPPVSDEDAAWIRSVVSEWRESNTPAERPEES